MGRRRLLAPAATGPPLQPKTAPIKQHNVCGSADLPAQIRPPLKKVLSTSVLLGSSTTGSIVSLIAALRPMRARRPGRGSPCCRRRGAEPIHSGRHGPAMIRTGSGSKPPQIRSQPAPGGFLNQSGRPWASATSIANISACLRPPASPFRHAFFERATQIRVPTVPPGRAFGPAPQQQAVAIANPFRNLQSMGVRQ